MNVVTDNDCIEFSADANQKTIHDMLSNDKQEAIRGFQAFYADAFDTQARFSLLCPNWKILRHASSRS